MEINTKEISLKSTLKDVSVGIINTALEREQLSIEGRKFGVDIFYKDLKECHQGISLMRLAKRSKIENLDLEKELGPPLIRRGIHVDSKTLEQLYKSGFTVVPILMTEEEIKSELTGKKAPKVIKKQLTQLAERSYTFVSKYFKDFATEKEVNIQEQMNAYKSNSDIEFAQFTKDWTVVYECLIDGVVKIPEQLSIINIMEDWIGEVRDLASYENHILHTAILSTLLAHRCGLKEEMIKKIATAGLFHDFGVLLYDRKIFGFLGIENFTKEFTEKHFNEIISLSKYETRRSFFKSTDLFERALIEYINEKMKSKNIDPYEINSIYSKHPLYSTILLTDKDGKPAIGLDELVLKMIYQHEYFIDGSMPFGHNPYLYDKELSVETEKVYKTLGINNKTQFKGINFLEKENLEDKDKNIQMLEIGSQILNVVERFLSLYDEFKIERDHPYYETIRTMYKETGTKLNGKIWEIFFNKLIPKKYYPQGLIVRVGFCKEEVGGMRYNYKNCKGFLIDDFDKKTGKIQKKCVIKWDAKGKQFNNPIIINIEKGDLYFIIDDWTNYY